MLEIYFLNIWDTSVIIRVALEVESKTRTLCENIISGLVFNWWLLETGDILLCIHCSLLNCLKSVLKVFALYARFSIITTGANLTFKKVSRGFTLQVVLDMINVGFCIFSLDESSRYLIGSKSIKLVVLCLIIIREREFCTLLIGASELKVLFVNFDGIIATYPGAQEAYLANQVLTCIFTFTVLIRVLCLNLSSNKLTHNVHQGVDVLVDQIDLLLDHCDFTFLW